MSKVKNYYMDEAEKTVDKILAKCKAGIYNTTVAKNTIIMVDNINLLGIDEYNIDEVIDDFMNDDKIKVSIDAMTKNVVADYTAKGGKVINY